MSSHLQEIVIHMQQEYDKATPAERAVVDDAASRFAPGSVLLGLAYKVAARAAQDVPPDIVAEVVVLLDKCSAGTATRVEAMVAFTSVDFMAEAVQAAIANQRPPTTVLNRHPSAHRAGDPMSADDNDGIRRDVPGLKVGSELTLTLYRMQGDDRWQCAISGPCPPQVPDWADADDIASQFLTAVGIPIGGVIVLGG
jgi:hypothetical protein